MTREEAIKIIDCYDIGFYDLSGEKIPADKLADAFDMAIEALRAEPQGDLISRADAIERFCECGTSLERQGKTIITMVDAKYAFIETLESLPSAEAETVDCTEFIRWLTETVMDDGMWELNAVAYGEVIARKLTKLGVLEVKDDVYVYEPSAEPKTGEWVKVIDEETPNVTKWHYECDQCGRPHDRSNYCPNCGAMMKGGVK